MNRKTLDKRGKFRLKERHLWPSQFRGGMRSLRIEWERIQKMIAQLPLDDLPEFAQQWVWMIERTEPSDIRYHLRRGDFPFFDAWAHRFHVIDETMKDLGYGLPARTPIIYAGYVVAGLAVTAQGCFRDAGGPEKFSSPFATSAETSTSRGGASEAEQPPEHPNRSPASSKESC